VGVRGTLVAVSSPSGLSSARLPAMEAAGSWASRAEILECFDLGHDPGVSIAQHLRDALREAGLPAGPRVPTIERGWNGWLATFGHSCPACLSLRHRAVQPHDWVWVRARPDNVLLDTGDRWPAAGLVPLVGALTRLARDRQANGSWFVPDEGGIEQLEPLPRPDCALCGGRALRGGDRVPPAPAGSILDARCGIVTQVEREVVLVGLTQVTAAGVLPIAPDGQPLRERADLARGADAHPALAEAKAVSEAVERYALLSRPASPPTHLWPSTARRITTRELWPGATSSEGESWVPASLLDGTEVLVPFALVWPTTPPAASGPCVTSNGMAAHPERQHAIECAVLELIERDALLRAWAHRAPALGPAAPGPVERAWIDELAEHGVEVRAWHLASSTGIPVVLAQGRDVSGTRIPLVVGSAARPLAPDAVRAAVMEVAGNVMAELRTGGGQPADSPVAEDVRDLEDHVRFYHDPRRWDVLDFLDDTATGGTASSSTETGVDACRRSSIRVAVADMTPPELDGVLHVVRAMSPDLVPLWFGADRHPRGHSGLPRELGHRPPHPFW